MHRRFSQAALRLAMVALTLLLTFQTISGSAESNVPNIGIDLPGQERFPTGAKVYRENCAGCHDSGVNRAPQKIVLRNMSPESIRRALTTGAMKVQAAHLDEAEKDAVSQHLAGRAFSDETDIAAKPANMCKPERAAFDYNDPAPFTGWGLELGGSHAIPTEVAGLDRENVGTLKLKWAFGFPDSIQIRSQASLAGGAIYVGSQNGTVYALDRETGCVRWTHQASAEVRTTILIDPWKAGSDETAPRAYFGDLAGNAYAVDAASGELIWKKKVGRHPAAVLTAAPSLHDGTLYVPVSSQEEASAAVPGYECCTFRGSIAALDAATGEEKWRTYLVDEPVHHDTAEDGSPRIGPSGVAAWNSPAIDAARGQLYVATGDNYSAPATELSDAILALDLETGAIRWSYQATEGDAWNVACYVQANMNCPEEEGPDFDFGAGTILTQTEDGRSLVLAGQKSGIVYAVDADTGELVWQTRVGRGGAGGGTVFGIASANGRLFVPISDLGPVDSEFEAKAGIHAVDIDSGKIAWQWLAPDTCGERKPCHHGTSGSVSATPELVIAGADDGHLRVFDAASGEVLWHHDTSHDFETVNGVAAHGGAISGSAAPIAHDGELIAVSGYGYASKMPGNVLLVFEAE